MISLRSKVTQKVLSFLFLHDKEEFYARELARLLNLPHSNLIKKLHEFEKLGLFTSQERGQEKYYRLNIKFPLLKEYKAIVQKTFGFEQKLKECLQKIDGIQKAIIFGSYAKNKMDEYSDIDLLVIGDHKILNLHKKIADLQKDFNREINVVNMSKKEFSKKRTKDPFLKRLLNSSKIEVI